jgi:hypothetical protein
MSLLQNYRTKLFGALALSLLLSACGSGQPPPSPAVPDPAQKSYSLHIPDRRWVPEAPKEGWCGETSIQMAALHFGAYLPQSMINAAGNPGHPDLWEYDISAALDALSLSYEQWAPPVQRPSPLDAPDAFKNITVATFRKDIPLLIRWIKYQVSEGYPVVIGTKIYPTDNPEWIVDHIMLVEGYTKNGLIIDTNSDDGQVVSTEKELASQKNYSFVNYANKYYAFAVKGFSDAPVDSLPVTLSIPKETRHSLSLNVTIESLKPGSTYTLLRDDLRGKVTSETFTANKRTKTIQTDVGAKEAAKFTCVPE